MNDWEFERHVRHHEFNDHCLLCLRERPQDPATTEPAVLEHDGLGQATTNRKEA